MPIFEPPTADTVPPVLPSTKGLARRLFRHYKARAGGLSVLRLGGAYQTIQTPSQDQCDAASEVYLGGHIYGVDDDTAARLTAAGYSVIPDPEPVEPPAPVGQAVALAGTGSVSFGGGSPRLGLAVALAGTGSVTFAGSGNLGVNSTIKPLAGTGSIVFGGGSPALTVTTANAPSIIWLQDVYPDINVNGQNDETDRVNAFFANIPGGKIAGIPEGALIRCDFRLNPNGSVFSPGVGATFFTDYIATGDFDKRTDPTYDVRRDGFHSMFWQNRQDFTVEGITVKGSNRNVVYNTKYESQSGFELHNCRNFTFRNCHTRNTWGDGFRFGDNAPGTGTYCVDGTVSNCSFYGAGRQLMTIATGDRLTVEDSHFERGARTCFDFERFLQPAQSGLWRDITIRNCTVKAPVQNNVIAFQGKSCINLQVIGLTLTGKAIRMDFSSPNTTLGVADLGPILFDGVTSDTMLKSSLSLFDLAYFHDVTVRNCSGATDPNRQQPAVKLAQNQGAYCVDGSNSFPGASAFVQVTSGVNPGNCA